MPSLWDGSGNIIRSNGTNSGATLWQADRDAGTLITATAHDTHDENIADSLELALNLGGENSPTANIDWGGQKITNLGNATAAGDAVNLLTLQNNVGLKGTTSGSSTAYTLALAPTLTALVDGMVFWVKFHTTSGAVPTLNIDGLGALGIKGEDGVAIPPEELIGNRFRPVLYDSGGPQFRVLDSGVATRPGSLSPYVGATAPDGWLFCDGSAISRTSYVRLFNTISTTFGAGDGSTTFNIPDLRGRVPAGRDDMGGAAANRLTSGSASGIAGATLGAAGGDEEHTLTTAELARHNHLNGVATGSTIQMLIERGQGGFTTTAGIDPGTNNAERRDHVDAGTDNAHNNVQPTLVVNYIIKA